MNKRNKNKKDSIIKKAFEGLKITKKGIVKDNLNKTKELEK